MTVQARDTQRTETTGRRRRAATGAAGLGVTVALMLAAFNLRPALASVGPLLDQIRGGVGMNATWAGLLTALPSAAFAASGACTPRLARRLGPGACVGLAMALVAVGLLARSAATSVGTFLAASAVAVAGIGIANVAMPAVVRRYFPDQVGRYTGLYSTLLTIGAALAAAAAVPVSDVGGSWRIGLGIWAVPAVAAALAWVPRRAARHDPVRRLDGVLDGPVCGGAVGAADSCSCPAKRRPADPVAGTVVRRIRGSGCIQRTTIVATTTCRSRTSAAGAADRLPTDPAPTDPAPSNPAPTGAPHALWHSRSAWALAVFFGLQAAGAYIVLGWLPQILRDAGVADDRAGLLLALTPTVGIPFAFLVPTLAARMRRPECLVAALAAAGLLGYAGLAAAPAALPWLWAVLLGISQAAFPLALTLIGMQGQTPAEVTRLSAFAQGIGYLIATPCPLAVGVLNQYTHGWTAPIAFMAALLLPQTVTGIAAARAARTGGDFTRPGGHTLEP